MEHLLVRGQKRMVIEVVKFVNPFKVLNGSKWPQYFRLAPFSHSHDHWNSELNAVVKTVCSIGQGCSSSGRWKSCCG